MSHTVYSIRGLEITNYSQYPAALDVRDMFGFGMPLDYQGGLRTPGVLRVGWGAAVTMVADAMGVELDQIRESCESQPATRRIDAASGVVEEGTVGAGWTRCIGVVDGMEAITIEHIDRMADDFAPDWPKGRDGGTDGIWRVIIDGEPSFAAEFQVGYRREENTNDQGLLATGMRALNAIPWVREAEPGIVEALHLPLTPTVGGMRPRRDGIKAFRQRGCTPMGSLDGKIAIVTGTSRGVGVGIAHELLRAGATVIGCSRKPLDGIPGAESQPGWAQRSEQLVCDQGDHRAIDAMVHRVVETHGRIDILVNNAGGTVPTPHAEDVPELVQKIQGAPRSDDDYERTALFHAFAIQMNLISPLWFAIRVFRQMKLQDGTGCIINISSGASHPAGSPTLVSYGAAKSGLNQMTRSLAEEWGPHARVNALALGPHITDNFRAFVLPKDDPAGARYFAKIPLRRGGELDEVGRVCVFLAGGGADFINGTTIEIDGGMMPGVLYEAGLKTITDLL